MAGYIKEKDRKRKPYYKINTPIRDRCLLYKEYIEKGKTRKQIAFEYRVKLSFVKDLLHLYSIRKPGSGFFKKKEQIVSDEEITKLYVGRRKTLAEVACITGDTVWVIRRCLKRLGIEVRTGKDRLVKGCPMQGKLASFETRKKQSVAKLKIPANEWVGFSPRSKRPGAKRWKKLVLNRDNSVCKFCSAIKNIEAHHIIPVSIDIAKVEDVGNGIALCKDCHKSIRYKEMFVAARCFSILRTYEEYRAYVKCGSGSLYVNPEEIVFFKDIN